MPVRAARCRANARAEFRPRVDAGADRGAALRQRVQPRHHRPQARVRIARSAPRQPPSSCAERDRHRIHQMRAAGLDHIRRTRPRAAPAPSLRRSSAGSRCSVQQQRRRDVNRRRHDIVAALAHVDVIVRVHRLRQARARPAWRSPRWHSCCCWCRNRSETHPPEIDRRAGPSATSSAAPWMALRDRPRQIAQLGVRAGGRMLDEPQCANEGARHAQARCGGKFCIARWVCAPHNASAGTSSAPMLSCSTRVVAVIAPYSAGVRSFTVISRDSTLEAAAPPMSISPSLTHSRRSMAATPASSPESGICSAKPA